MKIGPDAVSDVPVSKNTMNTPPESLPEPWDESAQHDVNQAIRPSPAPVAEGPAFPRVVRSEEILQGETEVQIVHLDKVYRLRRTRNGKLILQK